MGSRGKFVLIASTALIMGSAAGLGIAQLVNHLRENYRVSSRTSVTNAVLSQMKTINIGMSLEDDSFETFGWR